MADACGPEESESDAIQFAYQQITGIPNLGENQQDPRVLVPGMLVTRFLKTDPIFVESGGFSESEKNACINFDTTPRELICEDQEPVLASMLPVRWEDEGFLESALLTSKFL